MKKDCSCKDDLEGKGLSYKKVIKNFKMVSSTLSELFNEPQDETSTSILKCKKCNSYYIIYDYGGNASNNEAIKIIKYSPNITDKGLEKILNQFKGIVSEEKIEEYSRYISMMEKKEEQRNELKTGYSKN